MAKLRKTGCVSIYNVHGVPLSMQMTPQARISPIYCTHSIQNGVLVLLFLLHSMNYALS